MTVKFRSIMSKVNSHIRIAKPRCSMSSVSKPYFPHGLQLEFEIPLAHAMHDGQALIHPLCMKPVPERTVPILYHQVSTNYR